MEDQCNTADDKEGGKTIDLCAMRGGRASLDTLVEESVYPGRKSAFSEGNSSPPRMASSSAALS